MPSQILKTFLMLVAFLMLPSFVWAAPTITSTNGSFKDGQIVTILGSEFGAKTQAAPLKFINFNNDMTGQVPAGWISSSLINHCNVTTASSYTGTSGLDCSVSSLANDYFPRITLDTGGTAPLSGYFFLSAWVYLDETGTTATTWNWKGPLISSSLTKTGGGSVYWEDIGTSTTNTAFGTSGWYNNGDSPHWFNTALTTQVSTNGVAAYNYCTAGNSDAPDTFSFNGWHRMDWIFKTSSSGGIADGAFSLIKDGAVKIAATGCLSNGNTGDLWRYVSLPQGFTNIFTYGTPTAGSDQLVMDAQPKIAINPGMTISGSGIPSGTTVLSFDDAKTITMSANASASGITNIKINGGGVLNLRLNFDDVYIDNTIARVEICNASTKTASNHCEIQIPENQWDDGQLQIKVNQGSFADGPAYLYVIDSNGNANVTGYPITFTSAASTYSVPDFITLLTNWLKAGTASDVDLDQMVNAKDLGIMMSKWQ